MSSSYQSSVDLDGVGQIDVGGPGVDGPLRGHDGVGDDDLLARDQRVVGRRIKVEVWPWWGLLGLKKDEDDDDVGDDDYDGQGDGGDG